MRPKQPNNERQPSRPSLSKELEQVLQTLRSRIAAQSDPGSSFALVRLVKGLRVEDWQAIATEISDRGWLALPLDEADGTRLQGIQETLEELAYQRDHDILTGLANRRLFDSHLEAEIQRADRTQADLSLVMLDIDNFKAVNDNYGHQVGDQVLARLGSLLARSLRTYDVAARIGGEEFCLILPGASAWRAKNLANRILGAFRNEKFTTHEGAVFSVTFSAGVATAPAGSKGTSSQELVAQADSALYFAKREGKNRIATIKPHRTPTENSALVRPAEKQFLFTGEA